MRAATPWQAPAWPAAGSGCEHCEKRCIKCWVSCLWARQGFGTIRHCVLHGLWRCLPTCRCAYNCIQLGDQQYFILHNPCRNRLLSFTQPSTTQHMDAQHLRILMRHVLMPFLRGVPQSARDSWALPVLRVLLPHLHARLTEAWAAQHAAAVGAVVDDAGQQPQQGPVAEGSAMADEIIKSRLLVELTKEVVALLALLHEKQGDGAAGTVGLDVV